MPNSEINTPTSRVDFDRYLLTPEYYEERDRRAALVRAQIPMLDKYQIIRNPSDKRLYAKNKPVRNPQDWIAEAQTLVGHLMIDGGCGLAAPQMGLNIQMCVVKPPDMTKAFVFFNPVVDEAMSPDTEFYWDVEGCVSHPGVWVEVARPRILEVRSKLLSDPRESLRRVSGWFARILGHEIDHLRGKLVTDLGRFSRNLVLDPLGQHELFSINRQAAETPPPEPETD